MTTAQKETHTFQAEVQQLLDIVIHSLYTDKEIFIRELVSNAADSLEKLRHHQLQNATIYDDGLPLEINIRTDDQAGTLIIQDYGVGMTHDELIENLGTIAHSGSKAFAKALQAANATGENARELIGQFGVGFYAAFMVAKEVKVYTHSYDADKGDSLVWTCDGTGSYSIEAAPDKERRGARILIRLKDEDKNFAKTDEVKRILKRYSSFVPYPIKVNGEQVNEVEAIWMRDKSEVTEEQYKEFYKFQANAFDDPLYTLHFNADAPLTINSLLFTPQDNMERYGFGRMEPGVSLYCKKVLIDDKPEGLLPEWLRFLRGVVDSADLPLNISRESMQDSALVQKLNKVLTGRYLKLLADEAKKDEETYEKFYKTFGVYLKEGITSDYSNREKLAKLLRYASSKTEKGKTTSLQAYVDRMPEDQKEIYYLFGPNRAAIENGPYMEAFRAKDMEVLYLYEQIDEFVMSHLAEFAEKKLVSTDSAQLDIDAAQEGEALTEEQSKALCEYVKQLLGDEVKAVNVSKRLVDSPALAVNDDPMATPSMRRLFRAMQPEEMATPDQLKLEINPRHALIRQLAEMKDQNRELAELVTRQIWDTARMDAGLVEDPRALTRRIYDLLGKVAQR